VFNLIIDVEKQLAEYNKKILRSSAVLEDSEDIGNCIRVLYFMLAIGISAACIAGGSWVCGQVGWCP